MADHDHDHRRLPHRACASRRWSRCSPRRGLIDPATVDAIVRYYEEDVGPLNGARVVARAWVDPEYRRRLLDDATAAIAELGFAVRRASTWSSWRTRRRAQRRRVHAVLLLPVAGAGAAADLVQVAGVSIARRARAAHRPERDGARRSTTTWRSASGTAAPRCATWCSRSARPAPTTGREERLAALVTRDAMIGTATPRSAATTDDARAAHRCRLGIGGLLDAEGPAAPPRRNGELVFDAPWESRLFGLTLALHRAGLFEWDEFRRLLIDEIETWERAHVSGEVMVATTSAGRPRSNASWPPRTSAPRRAHRARRHPGAARAGPRSLTARAGTGRPRGGALYLALCVFPAP